MSHREPLLVLLGAGASQGIAPSTGELTTILKSWHAPDIVAPDPLFGSVRDTERALQPNFEDLIATLDEIRVRYQVAHGYPLYDLSYCIIDQWHPMSTVPIPHLTPQGPSPDDDSRFDSELILLSHEARIVILETVLNRVLSRPRQIFETAPINQLFWLLSQSFSCTIASLLNYDSVLDYTGLTLHHGFGRKISRPVIGVLIPPSR